MRKANNFHTIDSLRQVCVRRIPKVASEYLESGTGDENLLEVNKTQFESFSFTPKFVKEKKL